MQNHHVINEWKCEMTKLLKMKYGNKFNKTEISDKLDHIIDKNLKNPSVSVFNNYTNESTRSTILELTDFIEEKRKEWHESEDPNICLEVGMRLVKEIIENTNDNTGLIDKLNK